MDNCRWSFLRVHTRLSMTKYRLPDLEIVGAALAAHLSPGFLSSYMQVPALLSPLSDKQTISLESLNLWCTNNDKECLKKNRRKDLMRDILACIPSSSAWRNWCCAPKSLEPQCQKGVAGAASSCVGPHCGASDPGTCWQRWPDPQTELKLGELSTSKHKDNGMSLRQ